MILVVINIAICDDEILYIENLQTAIKKYKMWQHHTYELHIFTSGIQLIDAVKNGLAIDILFIDIMLDHDSLGTNIGAKLKVQNPEMLIVYISAFERFYKEIASAEPFDFIHKPIFQMKLDKVLDKAIMRISYIKHEFIYQYKSNGALYRVNLNNVVYFESQHRIINIYCSDNTIQQFYAKLDDVEKDIEEIYPCFLRANKSYFINFNYITKTTNTTVTIGDMALNLGLQYKESFHEKYDKIAIAWYI